MPSLSLFIPFVRSSVETVVSNPFNKAVVNTVAVFAISAAF